MGAKVGGIAVHLGARILGAAEPGQIVVSGTVRDLVTGAGFSFRDLGARSLKGVAEEWRLFAVERPARAGDVRRTRRTRHNASRADPRCSRSASRVW